MNNNGNGNDNDNANNKMQMFGQLRKTWQQKITVLCYISACKSVVHTPFHIYILFVCLSECECMSLRVAKAKRVFYRQRKRRESYEDECWKRQ